MHAPGNCQRGGRSLGSPADIDQLGRVAEAIGLGGLDRLADLIFQIGVHGIFTGDGGCRLGKTCQSRPQSGGVDTREGGGVTGDPVEDILGKGGLLVIRA